MSDIPGWITTTATLTVGTPVSGEIDFVDDWDWYRVNLTAGRVYYISQNGVDSGAGTLADPFLWGVYDVDGDEIPNAWNDDIGYYTDSWVRFVPSYTGTFYVAASAYGTSMGTFTLAIRQDTATANTSTTASLTVGTPKTGAIDYVGDRDWYRVTLTAGVTYAVSQEGSPTGDGTLYDPFIRGIFNSAGTLIAGTGNDDNGLNTNSLVRFTPTQTGTYYIAAGAYDDPYDAYDAEVGSYTLKVLADAVADDTSTTAALTLGTARTGSIDFAGDHDWYRVHLTAGTRYLITENGSPSGAGTLADPYIRGIYNAAGNLIAGTSNDDVSTSTDAAVYFRPAATADYFIAAGAYGAYTGTFSLLARVAPPDIPGGTGSNAALVVGTPRTSTIDPAGDQDWFKVQLTAGVTYRIDLRGNTASSTPLDDPYLRGVHTATGELITGTSNDDFGTSYDSRVVFTPQTTGTYFIAAGGYGSEVGSYQIALSTVASSDPPASTATGATVAVGGVFRSTIGTVGDVDWVKVSLTAGQTYVVEERGDFATSSPLGDPWFRGIYNASGGLIANTANDDAAGSLNSQVVFTAPTTGNYYLAAGAYGSYIGNYTLSVRRTSTADAIADDTSTTGTIAVNGSVNGTIDSAREVDWYRVQLQAGTGYDISLRGSASGAGTLSDPYFRGVYDATGQLIAGTSNDDSGGSTEARIQFTPATTGTYYLAAAGYNDYTGTYRLSIDSGSTSTDIPATVLTTAAVAVGGSISGAIEQAGDVDWIRVNLQAGVTYRIQEKGAPTGDGTLSDPKILGIMDAEGQAIADSGNNDSGGTLNAAVQFVAPETGTYFIAAAGHGTTAGTYRVLVSEIQATDTTAPLLQAVSPADNSTGVQPSTNLTLTFNEEVTPGTGNILITGGGQTRTIAVTDTNQVSFNGEVVTINPTQNLATSTTYTVTMASGVVEDLAGNDFAGITSNTRFNFTTSAQATGTDSWTLMVYVVADNNLEQFGIRDLNEMESVDLPDNVNVVVLVDRAQGYDTSNGNWTDARRGAIVHDSNTSTVSSPLTSIGEANMGQGTTLTNFINWAAQNYQAENYGLVIWDHGGGIQGTSWDDGNNGDNLTLKEMRQAVDNSNVARFDLIGFDACLMGMAEQAFDLRNLTDTLVFSEETEPGDGWAYDRFLAGLATNPGMSSADLASRITQTYGQYYAGQDQVTLSAVATGRLGQLETALDNFVSAALALPGSSADWANMRTAASRALTFPVGDSRYHYVDLGDFADEVAARVTNAAVKTAAQSLATAVDDAVIARAGSFADATGLAIYLPYGTTAIDSDYTATNYSFLSSVSWADYLGMI